MPRRYWVKTFCTILLAGLLQSNSYSGSLRKIWELDLSKTVDAPANQKTKGIPVFAIRFSPDGQRIAANVAWYLPGGNVVSKLVVVGREHPNTDLRKFGIRGIADDYGIGYDYGGSSLRGITWSPSGNAITAGHTVIRLIERKTCEFDDNDEHGFVDSDQIVVPASPSDPAEFGGGIGPTKFDIFGEDCQFRNSWELPQGIEIEDVLADGGLFYGRVTGFPRAMEDVVIDSVAKAVVRSSPFWGGNARFANRGKVICSGRWPDHPLARPPEKRPVRCFDVDTGATIAEATGINTGDPIFAAQNGSRIVAHDVVAARVPFTGGEYGTILKRRVVWDFQTNVEIASWPPPTQAYDFYFRTGPPERIKKPFRVAISPDGKYIVEGGNGILRLYQIEP
jgi:hypothetical protein